MNPIVSPPGQNGQQKQQQQQQPANQPKWILAPGPAPIDGNAPMVAIPATQMNGEMDHYNPNNGIHYQFHPQQQQQKPPQQQQQPLLNPPKQVFIQQPNYYQPQPQPPQQQQPTITSKLNPNSQVFYPSFGIPSFNGFEQKENNNIPKTPATTNATNNQTTATPNTTTTTQNNNNNNNTISKNPTSTNTTNNQTTATAKATNNSNNNNNSNTNNSNKYNVALGSRKYPNNFKPPPIPTNPYSAQNLLSKIEEQIKAAVAENKKPVEIKIMKRELLLNEPEKKKQVEVATEDKENKKADEKVNEKVNEKAAADETTKTTSGEENGTAEKEGEKIMSKREKKRLRRKEEAEAAAAAAAKTWANVVETVNSVSKEGDEPADLKSTSTSTIKSEIPILSKTKLQEIISITQPSASDFKLTNGAFPTLGEAEACKWLVLILILSLSFFPRFIEFN